MIKKRGISIVLFTIIFLISLSNLIYANIIITNPLNKTYSNDQEFLRLRIDYENNDEI